MKTVQIFFNPNWRDIIQQANFCTMAYSEQRWNRAVITVGDTSFPGSVLDDFEALAKEKKYPKGTQIVVKVEYLTKGMIPTRPVRQSMIVAIYEVIA